MNGGKLDVFLGFMNNKHKIYEVENDIKIEKLKDQFIKNEHLQEKNININKNSLIFKDHLKNINLKNELSLSDYNIQTGDTIDVEYIPKITNHINLDNFIKYLKENYTEYQQIILSLFSKNLLTHPDEPNIEIDQQIKFDKIRPESLEVIIILIDFDFFKNDINSCQIYDLINLVEESGYGKYIKKYIKPEGTEFVLNDRNPIIERYREYFIKCNSKKDIINKKITWYLLEYTMVNKNINIMGKEMPEDVAFAILNNDMIDKIEVLGYSE